MRLVIFSARIDTARNPLYSRMAMRYSRTLNLWVQMSWLVIKDWRFGSWLGFAPDVIYWGRLDKNRGITLFTALYRQPYIALYTYAARK